VSTLDDLFDGLEADDFHDDEYEVVCNRCGRGGLNWQLIDGKWRLHTYSDTLHRCTDPRVADDFDTV
jgi:3-methyladenine DNA glycosylase Tag